MHISSFPVSGSGMQDIKPLRAADLLELQPPQALRQPVQEGGVQDTEAVVNVSEPSSSLKTLCAHHPGYCSMCNLSFTFLYLKENYKFEKFSLWSSWEEQYTK